MQGDEDDVELLEDAESTTDVISIKKKKADIERNTVTANVKKKLQQVRDSLNTSYTRTDPARRRRVSKS